jgi:NAD(P)-dependent dehydrogenase (short-subunit alcohol dehydrogenase family)
MDVARSQDCQAMAEHCLKTYGRIDILYNNVGILPLKMDPILEADEENWDLMMNVNLKSLFHTCRAVLPHMLKQGSGVIVNVSSVAAVKYHGPGFFSYSISKAGVN